MGRQNTCSRLKWNEWEGSGEELQPGTTRTCQMTLHVYGFTAYYLRSGLLCCAHALYCPGCFMLVSLPVFIRFPELGLHYFRGLSLSLSQSCSFLLEYRCIA